MGNGIKKIILLVEDDALIAEAQALKVRDFGYNVITVYTGEEALKRAFGNEKISLILMDIDLGKGISGPETAATILARMQIPIVFLTSHAEREMVEKVRGITRYGYVIKNSGNFVLQSSIEMAFELFDANRKLQDELSNRRQAEEELRESQQRLSLAAQSAHLGIWDWDIVNNKMTWDEEMFRMYGINEVPSSYGVEVWENGLYPDDKTFALNECQAALNDEKSYDTEFRVKHPDGSVRYIKANGIVIRDNNGIPVRMLGVNYDITKQKKIEDKIKAVQERNTAILSQIVETFYSLDNNWRFTAVNPAAERSPFGRPASEMLGKKIWDLYPGLVGTHIHQHYLNAAENHTLEHYEAQSPLNRQWYEVFMQGWSGGVDVYMRDITERRKTMEALQKSEVKYREIYDNAIEAIFKTSLDGRVIEANAATAKIFGYDSPEEIIEKIQDVKTQVYAFPDEREKLIELMNRQGFIENFELQCRQKNGKKVWVLLSARLVRDNEGNILHIESSGLNITGRKQAEKKLRESEEKFSNVFQLAPVMIAISDLETGKIIDANQKHLEISGYTLEELIGKTSFELNWISPEDRSDLVDLMKKDGIVKNRELTLYKKNGKPIYCLYTGYPIEVGGETKIVSISLDISDRKRVLDILKKSEERFSSFMDNSPAIAWAKDEEGRHVYLSRSYENRFNVSLNDWKGKTDFDLWPEDIARTFRENDLEVLEANRSITIEEVTNNPDGSRCIWWNVKFPFTDADGKKYVGGIGIDVTERKNAEEQIKSLLTEKEILLHEVQHRTKNNINTIYSLLSLQAQKLKEPTAVKALEEAARRVMSIQLLNNRLYQSDNISSMPVTDFLTSLVDEILSNFPNYSSIAVEKRFDEFSLEPKHLQSVGIIINELLTNIMKYAFIGRDSGLISVSAILSGEHVIVSIEDNGNGIPENIDFEDSHGFGLMLASLLTQQLHGTIKIERKNGTRVVLEFDK